MNYQTNNLIRKNKINKITVLLDNNLLSEQTNYHKYDIMCFNDFKSCFNELGLEYGFNVEYLDNHSILLQELQIQKPEFIINLVNFSR